MECCLPHRPPIKTLQPPFQPMMPISFSVGLTQLFGHPPTAILNLCGSDKVDPPKEQHILEMNNQEGIRIPLSLSEKYEDFEQEWYRADSKKDFLNHLFNEGVMIDALYDKANDNVDIFDIFD